MKPAKCEVCHKNEAIWAMQYVGEDKPTFTALGSHYRGFRLYKFCDSCKIKRQAFEQRLEGATVA